MIEKTSKELLMVVSGVVLLLSSMNFQKSKVHDYILYEDTVFTKKLVFIAEEEGPRKYIFRNVTFDSCDVWFLASRSERKLAYDAGFDSLVFENCIWSGYKENGLRVRGSHKFISVSDCKFYRYPEYNQKSQAMSFTASVGRVGKPSFSARVGKVNVKRCYIENIGIDSIPTGTGIFGQKLSTFHVLNNRFVINGYNGSAIKLDDVVGLDADLLALEAGSFDVDILIKLNRFEIKNAYSALTIEQGTKKSTTNIRFIENWSNYPIRHINTSARDSEFIGNTFDYTTMDRQGKQWYFSSSRAFKNQIWRNNKFMGCNCVMLETNPGVKTQSIILQNTFKKGTRIAERQPNKAGFKYKIID